jgi:DNA-binding NarL/FixJ family response regulator
MTSQRLDRSAESPPAANDTASRWKVLLAHDGALSTCDALFDTIREAMDDVQIIDAPSAESARSMLRRSAFDVCFVCLDLPPTPLGGIKLAQDLVRAGCPLVLVTRSLRWLPSSAAELRVLPWVPPEAGAADIVRAVDEAISELDADNQVTLDSSFEEDEDASIPQRISEI